MTERFEGFWTLQESADYFGGSTHRIARLLRLGFFPNAVRAGSGKYLLPISKVKAIALLTQEEKARFETKIYDLISRASASDLLKVSESSFHRWARRHNTFPDIAGNGDRFYGKYMYSAGRILTWAVQNKVWYDKKVLVQIIDSVCDEQMKELLKEYLGDSSPYVASRYRDVDLPIDRKQ